MCRSRLPLYCRSISSLTSLYCTVRLESYAITRLSCGTALTAHQHQILFGELAAICMHDSIDRTWRKNRSPSNLELLLWVLSHMLLTKTSLSFHNGFHMLHIFAACLHCSCSNSGMTCTRTSSQGLWEDNVNRQPEAQRNFRGSAYMKFNQVHPACLNKQQLRLLTGCICSVKVNLHQSHPRHEQLVNDTMSTCLS